MTRVVPGKYIALVPACNLIAYHECKVFSLLGVVSLRPTLAKLPILTLALAALLGFSRSASGVGIDPKSLPGVVVDDADAGVLGVQYNPFKIDEPGKLPPNLVPTVSADVLRRRLSLGDKVRR